MDTISELFELFQDLWATGNRWIRTAFFIFIGSMIAVILIGITGIGWLISIFTIVVAIGIVSLIIGIVDPVVIPIIKSFSFGKRAIAAVIMGFTFELGTALYMSIVTIEFNRELIPIMLLATMFFMGLVAVGAGAKTKKLVITLLVLITLAFFFPHTFKALKGDKGAGIKNVDRVMTDIVQTGHFPKSNEEHGEIIGKKTTVGAGKDKPLVFMKIGAAHTFYSNQPWYLLYGGKKKMYMQAGESWCKCNSSEGFIGARGIKDGTVIEITS